jgi:hypothetical protein
MGFEWLGVFNIIDEFSHLSYFTFEYLFALNDFLATVEVVTVRKDQADSIENIFFG